MKIKYKHYILGIASLFGIFCLGNSASAYSSESYHDDATNGDFVYYTAACDELDTVIKDGIPDPRWGYINITLSNDCQKDLVIPSGAKVRLSVKHEVSAGFDPDTGEKINVTYEGGALTNNTGDTITIENNATLVLNGEITNTTPGKAVINNSGRLFTSAAILTGNEEGYVLKNSGVATAHSGTVFNNSGFYNTGTFYVTGGNYLYHDMSQYLVAGCSLDNDYLALYGESINCRGMYKNSYHKLPEAIPNGSSVKSVSAYPEMANAVNSVVFSTDPSIVEVTGNALDGFTLTPKKSGSVYILNQDFTLGAGQQYSVVYDVENANTSTKDYLANNLSDDETHKIVDAVEADDTLYMDLDINKLDQEDVDTTYKNLVNDELTNGELLNYYDIYYLLKGRNAGEIARIDDLGDGVDDVVDVAVDAPEDLPEVPAGKTRRFFAVRIHEDGTRTLVDKLDVSKEGNKLRFKSGKFSTYALAYEDVSNISAPNSGVVTRFEDGSAQDCAGMSTICAIAVISTLYYISRKERQTV